MIFEQETLPFQILDVYYLEQGSNSSMYNANRNFDALSFRIESDAVIGFKNKQIELLTNHIGYFPSDVSYTRTASIDRIIVIHFKSFGYHSDSVESFVPENADKFKSLFYEILECWNNRKTAHKHEASSILSKIFAEMYKEANHSLKSDSKIIQAVKYINENIFSKDLSLKTAAKKAMISDTYFRKLFKEEFSISPKKYIINSRIKHAESLIITGYFSKMEIAEMCGYEDYKHFSTEFKKITGVSPSGYTYNYA